jgi:sulfoxide reductase heme-binding subunit YedZ
MPTRRRTPLPWLKPGIFVGGLVPLAAILVRVRTGALGADPIAEALNQLGLVAFIFLVASLACAPLKNILGWTWPIRIRRELGLFAFFYALLHVSTYTGLDQSFDFRAIWEDVTQRKFIFVGFAAFVLLVPLAVTSTNAAVRRLGFVRWKRLHRLAYVAGVLAAIHFLLRVKVISTEPLTYAAIVAVLLVVRFVALKHSRPTPRIASPKKA